MAEFLAKINPNVLYILSFLTAFIISTVMTPFSVKFAYLIDAVDHPKDRGMHKKSMPLAGGTAIFMGYMVASLFFSQGVHGFGTIKTIGIIIGTIIITIGGLLDDMYTLTWKVKMSFQILAALVVVYTGFTIDILTFPFAEGGVLFLGMFGKVLTVIWIVGVTNAVNFIDGLDGLAAGVSSIAALCLMFVAMLFGDPITVVLMAALAGACIGFLPHNFNPAIIFMGDTGSTFLGFTLAVISTQGMLKSYTAVTIIVAGFVLGLPIFDTFFAILRRLAAGKSPMAPDRGHLHHRLIDKGYSQKRAVITLYLISGMLGVSGILIATKDYLMAALVIIFVLSYLFLDKIVAFFKKPKK